MKIPKSPLRPKSLFLISQKEVIPSSGPIFKDLEGALKYLKGILPIDRPGIAEVVPVEYVYELEALVEVLRVRTHAYETLKANTPTDPEEEWNKFWKEIIVREDGSIDMEQLKKELADFIHIMKQATSVYSHVTDHVCSYPTYYAQTINSLADEARESRIEGQIADDKEDKYCSFCNREIEDPAEEKEEDFVIVKTLSGEEYEIPIEPTIESRPDAIGPKGEHIHLKGGGSLDPQGQMYVDAVKNLKDKKL